MMRNNDKIEHYLNTLPDIETERLIIRKFTPDDVKPFFEMMISAEVVKYLSGSINSIEKAEKFLKKQIDKYSIGNGSSFAVVLKESGELIGNIVLNIDKENYSAEISYVINDKYWNKGYATEVCKSLISLAFDSLDLNRVEADVVDLNKASIRVLEKIGMKYEGKHRQAAYDDKTNSFHDFEIFSVLKKEYKKNIV